MNGRLFDDRIVVVEADFLWVDFVGLKTAVWEGLPGRAVVDSSTLLGVSESGVGALVRDTEEKPASSSRAMSLNSESVTIDLRSLLVKSGTWGERSDSSG